MYLKKLWIWYQIKQRDLKEKFMGLGHSSVIQCSASVCVQEWDETNSGSPPVLGTSLEYPGSRTLCFRTMSSWGDIVGIHTFFTLAGNSLGPHFFCKSITYLGLLPWVKWSYFPIQENKILQVIYWCVNYHFQRRAKEHCGFSNCSCFEHVFIFVKTLKHKMLLAFRMVAKKDKQYAHCCFVISQLCLSKNMLQCHIYLCYSIYIYVFIWTQKKCKNV